MKRTIEVSKRPYLNLNLLLLISIVVPCLAIAIFSIFLSLRQAKDNQGQSIQSSSLLLGAQLLSSVENLEKQSMALTKIFNATNDVKPWVLASENFLRSNAAADYVILWNQAGVESVRTLQGQQKITIPWSQVEKNNEAPDLMEIVKNHLRDVDSDGSHFFEVARWRIEKQLPMITAEPRFILWVPFQNHVGERMGLSVHVSARRFFEPVVATFLGALNAESAKDAVEINIINKKGELVFDNDPQAILKFNLIGRGLKAAIAAISGKLGFIEERHLRRGVMQINAYSPVASSRPTVNPQWFVLVRKDTSSIISNQQQNFLWIIAATMVIACAFSWFAWRRSKKISRPIHQIKDEITGDSERLLNHSEAISELAESSSIYVNDVWFTTQDINERFKVVAASADEMTACIREISKNSANAAQIAKNGVELTQVAEAAINRLSASSEDIGKVIKMINAIADQTNLLALNATIESARAGESGKGFAVVANEVKDLSTETSNSTRDITKQVETIRSETRSAIAAVHEVVGIINQINDYQNSIATAIEEQTATANEISRNISNTADQVQQISLNMSMVSTASSDVVLRAAKTQLTAQTLGALSDNLSHVAENI